MIVTILHVTENILNIFLLLNQMNMYFLFNSGMSLWEPSTHNIIAVLLVKKDFYLYVIQSFETIWTTLSKSLNK